MELMGRGRGGLCVLSSYFQSIVDFFGIVLWWGSHQTHDEPLKIAGQLVLQITY